ncbi:S9 family peptidase [Sphingobacterium sp. lm-10]|uniref:S9 family peptidase n=1 Tax=Sphingobacterium sp. lm-10 TaxID=2944904 RepID=UPI0020221F74|nr:S9 family peptidase [Sphingobacterium sp. lm-10]MCL7986743.1 S9 family peptidase [Sphingobacterium sp. lm-10]
MKITLVAVLSTFYLASGFAQGGAEDYDRSKEMREHTRNKVYQVPQQITWSKAGDAFAYRVRLRDAGSTYVLVDATRKTKVKVDAAALTTQLSEQLGKPTRLEDISERDFEVLDAQSISFSAGKNSWQWDNAQKKLTKLKEVDTEHSGGYWGRRGDDAVGEPIVSPNDTYVAFIKNNNVYVRKKEDNNNDAARQLTYDGSPGDYYSSRLYWSADSRKLAAFRVRKAEVRQLTLLESSPLDQLQPKLQTRDYVKPGDALPQYTPTILDVENGDLKAVDATLISNQFSLTPPVWNKNNTAITFEYNQRGHQRYEILELSATTGATRSVIAEVSPTFIDYSGKKYRKDLEDSGEIIWASERDGWNHLYLFDASNGQVKNQITKGNWVVRGVTHVDEVSREIYFQASGMKKGEDPYLVHYYVIGMNGKGLRELTPEEANHQAYFNASHQLFVDVYSRADQSPVALLRDAKDGKMLMDLEKSDLSALEETGWQKPEVFQAKGRDGETDIWGVIIRPSNFDPQKKYPVIEYIYAGPHSAFVPKSFFANPSGMHELAELGFIVVQIDGMGTSHRSKAFHDVAWKNLKDAGFPDRIAWMKAAAAQYDYMDLERVGIYGTSAGGQSSTAGLLFHPEFYKVGVSSCGCHDNRMDKIWWNEQWMGWPVGPEYIACSNVENAHLLEGKLLLIVGELDDNVDPSSTYQLVDQLIKHGKDHDFIMVPGMGHSSGGDFGERKRRDFFVKHLLQVDPPTWNRS